MNIVIRADASINIGSGHVMRCLTLAAALRDKGAKIAFICRPNQGNMLELIREKGYSVSLLSNQPEEEYAPGFPDSTAVQTLDAHETIACLPSDTDWLIVDHYRLDHVWERLLRPHVSHLMVIDDLADRHHVCDVLLDQNYYTDSENRYNGLLPENCVTLLGPKYALLREEFSDNRKVLRERDGNVQRIFVYFGAADLTGETLKTLQALEKINKPGLHVDIVVGPTNRHQQEIVRMCQNLPGSRLYHQIENIAEVMQLADLAVGAGGTTNWERAVTGLPAIVLGVAENQRKIIHDMARDGYILGFEEAESLTMEDLIHIISTALKQPGLLQFMSRRIQQLVDGRGRKRVACFLMPHKIELRKAGFGDSRCLYLWRNSEVVRASANNSSPIAIEEHEQWLRRTLADKNRVLLIGAEGDKPVGVLRYDISGNLAVVSIYLVPGLQHEGYGFELLTAGEQWLKRNHPDELILEAEVKTTNGASLALFNKAGFKPQSTLFHKKLR